MQKCQRLLEWWQGWGGTGVALPCRHSQDRQLGIALQPSVSPSCFLGQARGEFRALIGPEWCVMWKAQEDVGGDLWLKLEVGDAHRAPPPPALSPSLWCWNHLAAAFIFKERDSLCSWNYVAQTGLKLPERHRPLPPTCWS